MPNYAEELAYWYLRLNGFFLVENFVIHRFEKTEDEEHKHASDADLLAVRFPFVKEIIGERPVVCHDELFKKFSGDKILGLIVEVKSSEKPSEIKIFDNAYRMEYALNRLGILKGRQVRALTSNKDWTKKHLENQGVKFQVGKLLIHNWKDDTRVIQTISETITLSSVKKFILARFSRFKLDKYGDRIFFPSSLIQFMIWERYALTEPIFKKG